MTATKRAISQTAATDRKKARAEPAFDVIAAAEAEGLPAASAEVLRLAIPFALQVPKEERHFYQKNIIEMVDEAIGDAENARQAKLDRADAAIVEHARVLDAIGRGLAAEKEEAARLKESKEMAYASSAEAEAAVTATVQVSAAAVEKMEAHNAEDTVKRAEKETYEKTRAETWEKLKAAGFAGKDWKKRDKEIARIVQMLQKPGIGKSLEVALETALKQKVDERGHFAMQALQFVEEIWEKFMKTLDTEIEELSSRGRDCQEAVEKSEAAVASAREAKDVALNAAIAADNAWAEKETKVYELTRSFGEGESRSKELSGERDAAALALQSMGDQKASFEALRDRTETVDGAVAGA